MTGRTTRPSSGGMIGGLHSDSAAAGGETPIDSNPPVDPQTFLMHLKHDFMPMLFDTIPRDIETHAVPTSIEDQEDLCRQFVSDPSQLSLSLVKDQLGGNNVTFEISLDLNFKVSHVTIVVLIKRLPTVEAGRPFSSQLQVIQLPGPSADLLPPNKDSTDEWKARNPPIYPTVYESLHQVLHFGISPYFNSFVTDWQKHAAASAGAGIGAVAPGQKFLPSEDTKGIPLVQKKMAELELSLLQLQQQAEVPEIYLSVHPAVQQAVQVCRSAGRRVTPDVIPSEVATESGFLNALQAGVNVWIKEIQQITRMPAQDAEEALRTVTSARNHGVFVGIGPGIGGSAIKTAKQEVNFWLSMERSLVKIREQLKSEEIVMTLEILKQAKRFHATMSFLADTGLKEAIETVGKYNLLMREFPLDELLYATNVSKIRDAVAMIFGHLNKKLRLSPYPVRRAIPLVEAISMDLNDQLLRVLGGAPSTGESSNTIRSGITGTSGDIIISTYQSRRWFMFCPYERFHEYSEGCERVFLAWDDAVKDFTNVARDIIRKRQQQRFLAVRVTPHHAKLKERIRYVAAFRLQHEQLQNTIKRIMVTSSLHVRIGGPRNAEDIIHEGGLGGADIAAAEEVKNAYEAFQGVDALDVSREGTELWGQAEKAYNERISRVENQIIARLRERLGRAKNANEMFRVFSKFNALFVRTKIQGAIQEYQTQLIDSVKQDIRSLHDVFRVPYTQSEAYRMSRVHDVPQVSGAIMWAKQIERQLSLYMKRVGFVLGKGWEHYAEGSRLLSESQNFRMKLDTRAVFDGWLADMNKRDLAVTGLVFDVVRTRVVATKGATSNGFLSLRAGSEGHADSGGKAASHQAQTITGQARRRSSASESSTPEKANMQVHYRLQLAVRFDTQVIMLFKEVRNLQWMNFQVPIGIVNSAKEAKRVYPYAVALMKTVRTYAQVVQAIEGSPAIGSLLDGYRAEVQHLINKGAHLKWEHFANAFDTRGFGHQQPVVSAVSQSSVMSTRAADRKCSAPHASQNRHVQFVRDFSSIVSLLREKLETVEKISHEMDTLVVDLKSCQYKDTAFSSTLDSIQRLVDQMNMEGYSNLDHWIQVLDSRIEEVLRERLLDAVKTWQSSFASFDTGDAYDLTEGLSTHSTRKQRPTPKPSISTPLGEVEPLEHMGLPSPENRALTHEVCLRNQVLYLDPPLEDARKHWFGYFQRWIATVCDQKRPQTARYELREQVKAFNSHVEPVAELRRQTFRTIIDNLGEDILRRAYCQIATKLSEVSKYVGIWFRYQSLWDLDPSDVYSFLGDDISKWQQILIEIRKARTTFDNAETKKTFGPIVIDYEQVQAKVNAKYDTWQREILNKFGHKLCGMMRAFFMQIRKMRNHLEEPETLVAQHTTVVTSLASPKRLGPSANAGSRHVSPTNESIALIIFVQDLRKKIIKWSQEIESFTVGQRLLERQRYSFPVDWLYVDQVLGEWSALNEILSRKQAMIQEEMSGLQLQILEESKLTGRRVLELAEDWNQNKPIQGDLQADETLHVLSKFEARVKALGRETEQLNRAGEALNLDTRSQITMEPILEELNDLKSVWEALQTIWKDLDSIREVSWTSATPRQIRQELDGLLQRTKNLPNRMRQYAAFEYIQETVKGYLRVNPLIAELKSEALRDRHWRQLFKIFKAEQYGFNLTRLTVGRVWALDLRRNESSVREILVTAQGEMALEEYLRQVRETWTNYALELVSYQNKCRLIRGWDDLLAKCSDHTNAISAMKGSPYYKIFEEEARGWEDKLNRSHALFDAWIDVQRQWVYLEGIFSGNIDVRNLLPMESTRFQNINTEFMAVMRKVYKSPFVLDVLGIPNIQRSLDRLLEMLNKIQKALGEYLERERSEFPRFYFVGDEDLLEIIGNSNNVHRVQKHMKKMFAGISAVTVAEDGQSICGMQSSEGEAVPFSNAVSVTKKTPIKEWLSRVEHEMRLTLALQTCNAAKSLWAMFSESDSPPGARPLLDWVTTYPAQVVVVSLQVVWTTLVTHSLTKKRKLPASDFTGTLKCESSLTACLSQFEGFLAVLAHAVLEEIGPITRRKCEQLITESVHQRDVLRMLLSCGTSDERDFDWLYQMRYYLDAQAEDSLRCLTVEVANARFKYGFEYLGVCERLVQTPLTDRCFLTLTQALDARLGGSPFGPAGTGKTESVKQLGANLGRFVLVFCCDEHFDFQAMGRIFIGLCQVGAWGCFDEFNRLEERILSAVSQQIQSILQGLSRMDPSKSTTIELVDQRVTLNQDTGIFITMNPGYAGRSNLPDNLKKLFRSVAMTKPDKELIAQVMLYSQGYRTAESLAAKVVPLFNLCAEQLTTQTHYDFGLRALKSVLVSAGNLKRSDPRVHSIPEHDIESADAPDRMDIDEETRDSTGLSEPNLDTPVETVQAKDAEQSVLVQSITETVTPKLVPSDIPLFKLLTQNVFPGVGYEAGNLDRLILEIRRACARNRLSIGDHWLEKVIQLYKIQIVHHGLMMVGPSGTGKSTAWRTLLEAMEKVDGVESTSYVIDPKAIRKESLYGTLDQTTREWKDGLFTHILRKILDNVRGEARKRHWIVFDGDVDPEWVENLNSVLDDNRLFTLPNGERLSLPNNVRVMFEVENLRSATPATVSRCGMVWFSRDVVTMPMIFSKYLLTLKDVPLSYDGEEDMTPTSRTEFVAGFSEKTKLSLKYQRAIAEIISPYFTEDGLVARTMCHATSEQVTHIMDFTRIRALNSLFSLMNRVVQQVHFYNANHPHFPMEPAVLDRYVSKRLLVALCWSIGGDSNKESRASLAKFISEITTIDLAPGSVTGSNGVMDFDVEVNEGAWISWESRVPTVELEAQDVGNPEVVIPTVDTVKHEALVQSCLAGHNPLVLCGPPGSGKTMMLFSAVRKLPELDVVGLNFSSATTPESLLRTLEQHGDYRKTPSGLVLSPSVLGKWLVIFCDEINLPAEDNFGTQRVISFLRQLVEQNGFWRPSDQSWVRLERIQFAGACNPPTDPGRVPLSHRFLRHALVVMVDYPGDLSLCQIYGAFNKAVLKLVPPLRGYFECVTNAMVDFYLQSQARFTPDVQAHYVYSPRELTRWVRGILHAIRTLENLTIDGLVRVWAHEGLRLFHDRLVTNEERHWTDSKIDEVALAHFKNADPMVALRRPILYSDWLSKTYSSVEREPLREYINARLKTFYEEELDVPLVLFNDVLDHVLRIDRVLSQPQGHLLLIGVSGAGKTTLSRFVAWLRGFSVFQIKVHNKYTGCDFDNDLRHVLRRSGCRGERICFIMDESHAIASGFLERVNTLLANAEVPGLFEGDEYAALITQCKEGAARDGLILDSAEELYRWFKNQVNMNLHVIFCMNPPENGLAGRAATSPALFNRCVLDWMGDWSTQAFWQVGHEFTNVLDIDSLSWHTPREFPNFGRPDDIPVPKSHREAVISAFVYIHTESLSLVNSRLSRRQGRYNFITPRHYLDFIQHYARIFDEKKEEVEDQQRHLNVGLDKLKETVEKVGELRQSLAEKGTELEMKNRQANEKLRKMVSDQQEAEGRKSASLEIQEALLKQEKVIEERRKVVMADLAQAEPAVAEAQDSVSQIRKQHLTEVRSMGNPPEPVKLAMEAVSIMLGHRVDTWRSVQAIIRKDDFIPSIVNFDTSKMRPSVRNTIRNNYMSNDNFTYEVVNRASKACGPLLQWVIAQVNYSAILDRVEPLRREVIDLEEVARTTKQKAKETDDMIIQLEASIASYKDEYATLISDVQSIKAEMERVQAKVDRSMTLMDSLSSEKLRWAQASETFEAHMATLVGDVLLAAAFLAYAGYFDQQYRDMLLQLWTTFLKKAHINYREDLSLTDYLSTADVRLRWHQNGLPTDALCEQNAIMLLRYNRYPLVVDPSGIAAAFLVNLYKDRKVTVTSFLDPSFVKNLEAALRFGSPLIVQDVESLDPLVNAVLNRELRRTGGRVLIRLGNQDIDFSPSFALFLTTRDPCFNFPQGTCSKVTFVNFTITRSSLQSQCLHEILRSERPDMDSKRCDLLKLQGQFQVRLKQLERGLLHALNESRGNLLDDDHVLSTLEVLKKEAAEIQAKIKDTDSVMQEVEGAIGVYTPLAKACSSVYFVLEDLSIIHPFYQFSLDFFFEIFKYTLTRNPNLQTVTDQSARLEILMRDIFTETFERASHGILFDDHLVLAFLLALTKLRTTLTGIDDREVNYLLQPSRGIRKPIPCNNLLGDEDFVARSDELIEACPRFSSMMQCVSTSQELWQSFMVSQDPAERLPACWSTVDDLPPMASTIVDALSKAIIIKTFRPEKVLDALRDFVVKVLGSSVVFGAHPDLLSVVNGGNCKTPIVLASVPGYDAGFKVEQLVDHTGAECISVAMGSSEGCELADKAIAGAVQAGSWVFLKNVHLASSWLAQLEKRLQNMRAHPEFRLFLTMETSPGIPNNLLRQSRVLIFESPPGLRANILQTLRGIPGTRYTNGPSERVRIHFMASWLHAILQERLRYVPLGWTKAYEFSDADQISGLQVVDKWLDSVSKGRSNISPDKIPWGAIRTIFKETVYGGHVDNEADQRLLDSFVDRLLGPDSYGIAFRLVDIDEANHVIVPEGTRMENFIQWAESLPEREPPSWLGLPVNAETVLMAKKGDSVLAKSKRMKALQEDQDMSTAETEDIQPRNVSEKESFDSVGANDASDRQDRYAALSLRCDDSLLLDSPAWMRAMDRQITKWVSSLPRSLSPITPGAGEPSNPLSRFFEREIGIGQRLLSLIRSDLHDLHRLFVGNIKYTNHLRTLIKSLATGDIPKDWRVFKVPQNLQVAGFMESLIERLDRLNLVAETILSPPNDPSQIPSMGVWFGGLFMPEAFLTATRQTFAMVHAWSLEELDLRVDLTDGSATEGPEHSPAGGSCFRLEGLKLEGAEVLDNRLVLSDRLESPLKAVYLRWLERSGSGPARTHTTKRHMARDDYELPVYLNSDRQDLLFHVRLTGMSRAEQDRFSQRGVAVVAAF